MGMAKKLGPARSVAVAVAVASVLLVFGCAPTPTTPGPTTTTSTTLPWSEPAGFWSYFGMSCSIYVFGNPYFFAQDASVNVDAPFSVAQGETFYAWVAPGEFIVPTDVQGYSISSMRGVTIRFPLSPNVQFVDAVMTAGFNMGPGYPSVFSDGTDLVYRVPGPFTAGEAVQMPAVRVEFTATGDPGSQIEYRMKSFGSIVNASGVDVSNSCRPDDPNPLFFVTSITPAP